MSLSQLLLRPARAAQIAPTSRAVLFSTSSSSCSSWQKSWDDEDASWSAPKPPPKPKAKRTQKLPRDIVHPPPTPQELERRARMRVQRAERLERKDLTAQLTETKTYMGGFTQPRHLMYLTTLDPTRKPKDSYDVRVGENRVRPAAEAYEPHTVYLAVTRYPVRWGHGRATRRECFSGFCKESELPSRFKALNYGNWLEEDTKYVKLEHGQPKQPVTTPAHWSCMNDSKEYIDLAVFPGSPQERSLLNKPISARIKAVQKVKTKRAKEKAAATAEGAEPAPPTPEEAEADAELAKMEIELRKSLLPPRPDFVRPEPPYLTPPLVVPLLTVTMPTRPLAATLARLCNGHPRGLPFIASVPNDDRKDGPSLFRRLLRMRANRIRELSKEMILKLEGYGGGLMGLRLSPEDKGRGIEGEGLGEEIKAPERGWVEVSWLDESSAIWGGIEREMYVSDWDDIEGAKKGPSRTEQGTFVGAQPVQQVEAAPAVEAVEAIEAVEVVEPVEPVEPVKPVEAAVEPVLAGEPTKPVEATV
ncbi:hypothetical protein JCM1840_004157 [Sporobolomyces johnsonii]